MGKVRVTVRFLLVSGMVAFCLSGCGGSGSSSSTSAAATAKTAAWTNVSVRAFDGMVNINWDKAAGSSFGATASTYNIYCADNQDMLNSIKIATQFPGTSFDYSDVTNGTRYYFVITEVSASGEGPASRVVSVTPQEVVPAAPFGHTVTALDGAAQLELIVPAPAKPELVSYNLYRSTSRTGFAADSIIGHNIPFATPITFSDTGLTNGTTYFYTAKTVISGKESGFSAVASVQPQAKISAVDSGLTQLAAFASPTDMSVEPGNGSCTVRWKDVAPLVISSPDPAASTVPYYILFRSDLPDVLNNIKGQSDDIAKTLAKDANGFFTYNLNGLGNGASVYLQIVAAVKGADGTPVDGRFTPGPVVSVTPGLKIPAMPSGVSATQGPQKVSLTWNKDSSGLPNVTYNVYVSTTDVVSPAELMVKGTLKNNTDSTKTNFIHSGLETGKTYYYVITAVGEGESAPSSIVSVTL